MSPGGDTPIPYIGLDKGSAPEQGRKGNWQGLHPGDIWAFSSIG